MASNPDGQDLHANHDPQLLAVVIIFTIFAVAAAALRIISRRMKKLNLWIDDYLIFIALVWVPQLDNKSISNLAHGGVDSKHDPKHSCCGRQDDLFAIFHSKHLNSHWYCAQGFANTELADILPDWMRDRSRVLSRYRIFLFSLISAELLLSYQNLIKAIVALLWSRAHTTNGSYACEDLSSHIIPPYFHHARIPGSGVDNGQHRCYVVDRGIFRFGSALSTSGKELGTNSSRSLRRFETSWNHQPHTMDCHRSYRSASAPTDDTRSSYAS